jgi:hypothetical protein
MTANDKQITVRVVRGTKDPRRAASTEYRCQLFSFVFDFLFVCILCCIVVRLRDMAIGRNSKDNVSVIVIQVCVVRL